MDGWLTRVPASLGACFSLCAGHRGWARSLTQWGAPAHRQLDDGGLVIVPGAAWVELKKAPHTRGVGWGTVATATPAATFSLKPVTQLVSRKRKIQKRLFQSQIPFPGTILSFQRS